MSLVRTIIAAGESYYSEFKGAWTYGPEGKASRDIKDVATDIGEAVVAFANSDGGDLLVGVEDSGSITGIPWDGDKLQYLASAQRSQVPKVSVGVQVHDVTVDGQKVLLFRVQEHASEVVVTSSGRCLWRKGATSEPIPPSEISRRRLHRLGDTSYEAQPIPTATLSDIALPWDSLRGRPHLNGFVERNDVAGLLRYWNLLDSRNGTVVLRRAALLLFAVDPLRWHPNNRVRLRWVAGNAEGFGARLGTKEREEPGPIARLAVRVGTTLFQRLAVESRTDQLFNQGSLLPRQAVEECLVNALAHRNYAIEGSSIEVLVYPDRVEFKSPGRLPEPLTISDLQAKVGVHRSRNPLVMRVLRDLGLTRDQGEGMRRIFAAMLQVELNEPVLEVLGDTFIVRLSTQSVYDDQTRSWIAAYGPFGLQPHERKYLITLRKAGGQLSVDKMGRLLDESYDAAKESLDALEGKSMVWHAFKSRSYHLVEPLSVPLERAYTLLVSEGVAVTTPGTEVLTDDLRRMSRQPDDVSFEAWLSRLKESGVISPSGKKKWKLGQSLIEYASTRAKEE